MATNLNPSTASFSTAGLLLGNEVYSQTVQQGVCENTGFNRYRPAHINRQRTDLTGTAGTTQEKAYLLAGTYSAMCMAWSHVDVAGTTYGKLDGTTVFEDTAAGERWEDGSSSVIVASDGWITIEYGIAGAGAGSELNRAAMFVRME